MTVRWMIRLRSATTTLGSRASRLWRRLMIAPARADLGRDGLTRMLKAARDKAFDVLIVEHPDRISRNMRDLAGIFDTLRFRGVEIRTVHGGKLDVTTVGLFG